MKSLIIICLLLGVVYSDKIFITFKNKACENLAQDYSVTVFGTETTFLKNLGIMIVEQPNDILLNSILKHEEFHGCINEVSRDEVISITSEVNAKENEKVFITFKNAVCENLAQTYAVSVFGSETKFLKNLGIMIVDHPIDITINKILKQEEFHGCINEVSKDEVITLSPIEVSQEDVNAAERKAWQLRRTNVAALPLPDTFTRNTVEGVTSHVYVIDSGIDGSHPDLANSIAPAAEHQNFTARDSCGCTALGALCDCNTHGTHCAGLIASPNAGYNPNTTLHAVKVFDRSGSTTWENVMNAMDWVAGFHAASHPGQLGIASMSLGGGKNQAINQAVAKLDASGVLVVVAAGNSNKDSCTGSPASAPEAFTVGASEIDDSRAYFSEFGSCVKIFAPGVEIWSTKPGNSYQYMSGTSMATPFVAGFASWVGTLIGSTDPTSIKTAINAHVSKGVVTNSKSTNNNLPFDGTSQIKKFLEVLK